MTTPAPPAGSGPASSRGAWVRVVGLLVVLIAVAVVMVAAGPDTEDLRVTVDDLGRLGPVVLAALYALLSVLLVPGAVLTTTAGVLFGLATGTVVALLGAVTGATVAFLIARHSTRSAVDRLLRGRAAVVDEWLSERGLVAVLSLRLVPLVPFSVANYAAGLSGIRPRDYLVGTALGIVPGTVAYVAVGARITRPGDPVFLVAVGGLAVLTLVGGLLARRQRSRTAVDR